MKVEVGHHLVDDIQDEVKKNLLHTGPDEACECKHCKKVTETKDYVCVTCKHLKGYPYLESK